MLRTVIYLIISLATIFYALPRVQFLSSNLAAAIFSVVWVLFALLIIGAQLDYLISLDEEKRKRLIKLKRYSLWKKQQRILKLQPKEFSKAKGIR